MRKACINEIKELTPYLQNIGDKYLVNTYSVQHIGEREFEGECKVIDFIDRNKKKEYFYGIGSKSTLSIEYKTLM